MQDPPAPGALLKKQYLDTGKLRCVIRDVPLEFRRRAMKAAEAAWADILWRNGSTGENYLWKAGDIVFPCPMRKGIANASRRA